MTDKSEAGDFDDLKINETKPTRKRTQTERGREYDTSLAINMGGVWERQIRSVRSVLNALLERQGTQLDDESLRTLMVEAEAVVNSRPLTTESASSTESTLPLSPSNLLTMKTKVILPPPGNFQRPDLYSRKRWRRVQFLANEFWNKWKKIFLQSSQQSY